MITVLLAEDDDHLRCGLTELLELEDFSVIACATAEHALEQFHRCSPDVCILDIMLPQASGLKLCRDLRKLGDTPVLFLSARCDENDRIRGFEAGADDYVCKPFNAIELIHRIRSLLRRSPESTQHLPQDTSFVMADLTIDPAALRAYRTKHCLELTQREARILTTLYQSANQVVRKSDLYEKCWGTRYISDSRALDQYISALRQKIELDPQAPQIIRTVRGTGYRYESS